MVPGPDGAHRPASVSLAVTNRCGNHCTRCYNAGRSQQDLPLPVLGRVAHQLMDLGACSVALTGGDPLLREDLEDLCACFDERAYLVVNLTGEGLTLDRARRLKKAGVFTVSVSLDSELELEHDELRGRPGAYRDAVRALSTAREAGLCPYVMTVLTRPLTERRRLEALREVARRAGAVELRLLEPAAVGGMAGRRKGLMSGYLRRRVVKFEQDVARGDELPIVSVASSQSRPEAFGCQAGVGHLYIDGSGEVCPCNFIPLSFGNVAAEPLDEILRRMGGCFPRPRQTCAARQLARYVPPGPLPTSPEVSQQLCAERLPPCEVLPGFCQLLADAVGAAPQDIGTYRPVLTRPVPKATRASADEAAPEA